jgi:hypothetical protein
MDEMGIFEFSLTEDEEFPGTLLLLLSLSLSEFYRGFEFYRKSVEQITVLPNRI